MSKIESIRKQIDKCVDEIYVSTTNIKNLEASRTGDGLPEIWKVLNELDRYEGLRSKTIKLLEKYFVLEKEENIPINMVYRVFYKELKK